MYVYVRCVRFGLINDAVVMFVRWRIFGELLAAAMLMVLTRGDGVQDRQSNTQH